MEVRIKQNYENYDRVVDAFKKFVHALVWESMDIDEGAEEEEVNKHIEAFVNTKVNEYLFNVNKDVIDYINSFEKRYEVKLSNQNDDSIQIIKTDNLVLALEKAAKFYRNTNKPLVSVYDNKDKKFIALWETTFNIN